MTALKLNLILLNETKNNIPSDQFTYYHFNGNPLSEM